MICWKYCPEPAIFPTAPPTIDYDYCKGCGICIEECPFDAIVSEKEGIELQDGILADVAPTLLADMGLEIPEEMTGKNLVKSLTRKYLM